MITVEDGDMPFDEKQIVSHSAGAISGGEADSLIGDLFGASEFSAAAQKAGMTVYPGSSFRHIAVQKTPDIKGITLIPPHDHLGERLGQHLPRGCENAAVLELLMRLSHRILDVHPLNMKRRAEGKLPANCIWLWAEGKAAKLPNFTNKYGRTGGVISAVPLCQGIGILVGLEKIRVEGATGEIDTNYEGKAGAALEALETRDFVVVHVEAPDECTHMGDTQGKVQAIEWIDSRILAILTGQLRQAGKDYRMLLISDHKTLTSTRGHDGSPVPFVIYDSRVDKQTGLSFCESDAARGQHIADGTRLMDMLFEINTEE